MRNEKGQFVSGIPEDRRYQVGSTRIRTRHKRNGEQRTYIKIAEPNVWVLLSRYVWEQANGAIPPGMGIHHMDGNKLNDELSNLELVSKSMHIDKHRDEFQSKGIAGWIEARRKTKWSTKSDSKRTGRHPRDCQCPLHKKT